MKSLQNRAAALTKALETQSAPELPILVELVTATTREEAILLQAMQPTPPPTAARVRLTAQHHQASDYLAAYTLPEPPPST